MSSWAQFAAEAPDLAAIAAKRLSNGVAYLATTSADGWPRVHPVSPIISRDGRLFIFMEPTSPKGHDLRRDGRYALHSRVDDSFGTGGEFFVRGRAHLVGDRASRAIAGDACGVPPEPRYILFEFQIADALVTRYEAGVPVRARWSAGGSS